MTKQYMGDITSLLGSENVFVLSIDDKAKVAIGVTAATKQSPLLIHVTYEIRLPDHDFVKAPKHKLTPSVYAACEIRVTSSNFQIYGRGLLSITCYPKANTKFFPTTRTAQASNQTSRIWCATTVQHTIPASLLLNPTKQEMDVKVTQKLWTKSNWKKFKITKKLKRMRSLLKKMNRPSITSWNYSITPPL